VWGWVLGVVAAELLGVATGFVVNLLSTALPGWTRNPRLLAVILGALVLTTVAIGAALARHAEATAGAGPGPGPAVDASGPRSGSGPAVDARGASGPIVTGATVYNPGVIAGKIEVHLPPAPEPVRGQVVVGEFPREPVAFQPRQELMAAVGGVLAGGRAAVVCALAGGRGVGKSQLAGAYARRRIEQGCPVVGWVNAETTGQILAGLAELAERCGVADPEGDSARSAGRLREHLSRQDARGLLVFDNATSADAVGRYAPVGPGVAVVVTTTDRSFGGLGRLVEVDVYGRAESLAYLAERTGLADVAGAGRVAEVLGDSPLALAQAAAVILAQRATYGEYLDLLAGVPAAQVLLRREGEPYPRGTAQAILLALDAAEAEAGDPGGWVGRVLRALAVLSADGVPRDFLGGVAPPDQPAAVDAALDRITTASLAAWAGVAGSGQVVMHRLVARVIRDRAQGDGDLAEILGRAWELIASSLPAPEVAWASREQTRHLPDQATAAWAAGQPIWATATADTPLLTTALHVRARCVRHLTATADLTRAATLGAATLTDTERHLGPDDADTLRARDDLANAHRAAGDLRRAIPLYEQTLTDYERVLGADHPNTIRARNELAGAYESAGDLGRAIPLHEQTLTESERVLGPDHPDTLASRNNLAGAYQSAGDLGRAIPLHQQTLTERERVLGPDHPNTLASRNNLAFAYRTAGDLGRAIPLHEQTLTESERVLGPDHPDTLTSRNNLAFAYQSAGDLGRAIPLYQQTLAECERVLGPDHPDTLTSRNNLAYAYQATGDLGRAIPLYEQTLAECERVLGPDHPHTLTSQNNLAGAYESAGDLGRAIPLYEQTLAECERVLGPDHPTTVTVRTNTNAAREQKQPR
jgi:tetratricopeptide (TPR) repeat protein